MNFSIRSYLLLLVGAFAAPLVSILAYSIYADVERNVGVTKASVRSIAIAVAANTRRMLATNQIALENLAKRPRIRALDEKHCDAILQNFHELFPQFANLTTIDLTGRIPCSAVSQPGGSPVSVAKTEWFQRAAAEKRFLVGNPFIGPITGKLVSVIVSPIRDERNGVIGFLGLPLDLSVFDPQISAAPLLPGARYGLFSDNNVLIWRNEDAEHLVGKNMQGMEITKKILAIKDGEFESLGTDGVRRIFSVVPVPEANWYAFVSVPEAAIYSEPKRRAIFYTMLAVAALLAIAGIAIALARRIVQPTRSLTVTSRAIRNGRTDVRAVISGPTELAEVVKEFNDMVDSRLHRESELLESRTRLAEATHLGHLAYWEYDCAGARFLFNDRFYELLRTDTASVGGYMLPADEFINRFVHADDAARVANHTGKSCTTADALTSKNEEIRIRCGDGVTRWFLLLFRGDPATPGDGCRLVGAAQDIHDRKSAEEQIAFLAYHDALTLLPNRVLLRDRMEQTLALMERREKLVAICYLDLDGFKPVNDLYGHKVGDLLLVEVAKRLKNIVRSADTVARLGGDEFVLLLGDLNSISEIEHFLNRVLQEVAAPYDFNGHQPQISASIGVTLSSFDHSDSDTLLRHADQAMYVAKQAGKNRFSFFNPQQNEQVRDQHQCPGDGVESPRSFF